MNETFSDSQKAILREILSNPLLELAMQSALSDVWKGLAGATTLEGAALAYKQMEGASGVLTKLYSMAELKRDFSVNPRKLKHTPAIP